MFIKLTRDFVNHFKGERITDGPIYINPRMIAALYKNDDGTTDVNLNGDSVYTVEENPETILRLMGGPDLNIDPPAPYLKGFTIEAMTPSDPKPLIEINEAGEAVTVTTETTIEVEEPTDYTNE